MSALKSSVWGVVLLVVAIVVGVMVYGSCHGQP